MKILTALKYCPVTGNIPMTCTEDGFLESCKSFRKLKSVSGGKNMKFTYCAVCNGRQRPKDLTIISLAAAQSAREKQEDNVDKKKDECEMCGKRANLRSVHKKNVCPSCGSCRTLVSSRLETVIEVLREFGHLPAAASGDTATAANSAVKDLRNRLDIALRALAGAEKDLKIKTSENGLLRAANIRLKEARGNGSGTVADFSHLAWKWLEGMAEGDITGLKIEDLRLLRGLQKKI